MASKLRNAGTRPRRRISGQRREHLGDRAEQMAAAAAAPAEAELHDQLQDTRRDTRHAVQSQHSMADALLSALDQARHAIGGIEGLRPEDRHTIKAELAQRIPDVAAGEAYGVSNARREGRETVSDIRSDLVDVARQEGLDAKSALADLIEAAKDRQAERAGSKADRIENQREHHKNATARSRDYSQQVKTAIAEGQRLLTTYADDPPDDEAKWALFQGEIAKAEGVNNPDAAAEATQTLRRQLERTREPGEGEIGPFSQTGSSTAISNILRGLRR